MRTRIEFSKTVVVEPLLWDGIPGRCCWHHVKHIIAERGGSFAYGWALGTPGPIDLSPGRTVPLYGVWVNHVLWSEPEGQLWEVTPIRDELTGKRFWQPTHFILDQDAPFEIATDRVCCPQPSTYVSIRPEGQPAAHCLNEAVRAPKAKQNYWVMKAVDAIRQAGLMPTSWRLKHVGEKLRDVLILVDTSKQQLGFAPSANASRRA